MLQNLEFRAKSDEPDRLEMFNLHVTCTNIMVKFTIVLKSCLLNMHALFFFPRHIVPFCT